MNLIKKIAEFEEFEKEKTKEFDVNNKKMKENYEEKVSYENIELKRDLELANKKINELKEYIVEKGKSNEDNANLEKINRENLEKNNKYLTKKIKEIEEKNNEEIRFLNNNLIKKEREIGKFKEKYEKKFKKLKESVEENKAFKEKMSNEIKSLMQKNTILENSNKLKESARINEFQNSNFNQKRFDNYSKFNNEASNMLNVLKEINLKMDEKI